MFIRSCSSLCFRKFPWLLLLNYGLSNLPQHLMNRMRVVLIPTQKILILLQVVGWKCLRMVLQLVTESKHTKAWPELTKGFIVSSISCSSYLYICFSKAYLFLYDLGTSMFWKQFGLSTVMRTR